MFIRHKNPSEAWVKFDKAVMTRYDLTDGAKVLYAYLSGVDNGAAYVDTYLCKALNCSQRVLTRRRTELRSAGLLLVEQIQPRIWVCYVGNSKVTADKVKKNWKPSDGLRIPGEDK